MATQKIMRRTSRLSVAGAARRNGRPDRIPLQRCRQLCHGAVLFADGRWTAIDGRFTPPL